MVSAELLEILRCPVCVREEGKTGALSLIKETWLVCQDCDRKYPIVEEIPVMLIDVGEKWMQTAAEALPVGAVNGDGLGGGERAEAARIEGIDLAAGSGLGDGAGPGLAGSGAAAGVDVVAHARHPCSRRLRLGHRAKG